MRRRVVITGLGPVTPLGIGAEAFWAALKEGRSGIAPISSFDADGLPSRIAGEVSSFEMGEYMYARAAQRMDRFCHFAVAGARLAWMTRGSRPGRSWSARELSPRVRPSSWARESGACQPWKTNTGCWWSADMRG